MNVQWSTKLDLELRSPEREQVDGEWQLVDPEGWWRTPIASVSWSFAPEDQYSKLGVALPNSFPLSPTTSAPMDAEDVSLNPDLVGFKLVEAIVSLYEKAVGFDHVLFPIIEREDCGLPPPLNLSFSEEDVLESRDRWKESVEDLMNADSDGSLSLSSSMTESARSEHSGDFFAMPATPVSKTSYANVLLKNVSPSSSVSDSDSHHLTPSKTLNASASSFVPSTEASSLSSFTFPTLNPPNKSTTRLTTVKIKKDDQGFFTDVQVEDTTQPLPSFLQEPSPRRRIRTSKTREIVDRLRSSQADNLAKCISHSPSPIFHDLSFIQPRLSVSEDGGDRDRESSLSTPSFDEDDEGWIDVGVELSPSTKAKRARDLFLALTRRRKDSTSSEPSKDEPQEKASYAAPNSEGWIEGIPATELPLLPPKLPPKPASPPIPAKAHRKKHHVHKSSTSSSIPPVSPTHPTFPGPPPYMGVPMMSPSHMAMMPTAPPPPPVSFFFSPAAPPYHPMPVSYATSPTSFLAPSPFGPVPLHPMTPPVYMPKTKASGLYSGFHPWKVNSSGLGTFGKSGQ